MTSCIWVTGAAGFTGRHLIDYLRRAYPDEPVVALGRNAPPPASAGSNITWVQADVTDPDRLIEVAGQYPPKWVFHFAALMPPADEAAMWHINVAGTHGLISALFFKKCFDTRILLVGSAAEYSHNDTGYYTEAEPCIGYSAYGKVKSAQSMLALQMGWVSQLDVIVARPFNLVGPGLSANLIAGKLSAELERGKGRITLGNIHSQRDFLDVRDAVRAYCLLLEKGRAGQAYNVCSGSPTSIETLVTLAAEVLGVVAQISVDENLFRQKDLDRVYGSNQLICRETGWRPEISLRQSLTDMMER